MTEIPVENRSDYEIRVGSHQRPVDGRSRNFRECVFIETDTRRLEFTPDTAFRIARMIRKAAKDIRERVPR